MQSECGESARKIVRSSRKDGHSNRNTSYAGVEFGNYFLTLKSLSPLLKWYDNFCYNTGNLNIQSELGESARKLVKS